MPGKTLISWTNRVWNPVTGCRKISPGCQNCYAERIANSPRFKKAFPNGFEITLHPDRLDQPSRWRKPSMIFVNSMSDLFHKDIPEYFLTQIWEQMVVNDHKHIFQILTKRPTLMAEKIHRLQLPLPSHIWLGVSIENQQFADNRIPALLDCQPKVAFVSAEPLLGEITVLDWLRGSPMLDNGDGIKWVIAGGESGPGHRPAQYDWFRQLRDECTLMDVPFFYKQGNSFHSGRDDELDGAMHKEMPSLL